MNRRRTVLIGATAAGAAMAGIGLRWVNTEPAAAVSADQLWSRSFGRPQGGELAMAPLRGQIVLLNFWATWCPPCVHELPEFDRLHRERASRGVAVIGLAVDNPEPVRQFLRKQPLGFAIGLAGLEGLELTRSLGNTTGSLPFTVLFGRAGQVRQRRLGQTHFGELTRWLDDIGT